MSDTAASATPRVPTLTIRRLPADVVLKLKDRAWRNRRSMEAEVREILQAASAPVTPDESNLRMHYAGALKLLEECSPHVPEQVRGLEALQKFIAWLKIHPKPGVEIFTRGPRWPIDGKPSARRRRRMPLSLPLEEAAR